MSTLRSGQGGRVCLGWGLSSWLLPKLGLSTLLNDALVLSLGSGAQPLSPKGERLKKDAAYGPDGQKASGSGGQLCSWQTMKGQHGNTTQSGIKICGVASLC